MIVAVAHPHNLLAGWILILPAFVSGAVIGLVFHSPRSSAATTRSAGGSSGSATSPWRRWA